MKLLCFVFLMALSAAAQLPGEKKVKVGAAAFQAFVVTIDASMDGRAVKLGGGWVIRPEHYYLVLERDGDKKRFDCKVGDIQKLTTGDSVSVTGKVVEIRNKATEELRTTEVDGCKLNNPQTTSRSQDQLFSGVITEKSQRSGLLAQVSFRFKTTDGKIYDCSQYLSSTLEPTVASAVMAQERLETFKEYKIGDTVSVRGFPKSYGVLERNALENAAFLAGLEINRLGLCEVREHTQAK